MVKLVEHFDAEKYEDGVKNAASFLASKRLAHYHSLFQNFAQQRLDLENKFGQFQIENSIPTFREALKSLGRFQGKYQNLKTLLNGDDLENLNKLMDETKKIQHELDSWTFMGMKETT